MSVRAKILAALKCCSDRPQRAADYLLETLSRDELREVLLEHVEMIRRGRVLTVEREAFAFAAAPTSSAEAAIRAESFGRVLAECFATGDGARISWGLATVEQHQFRIDFLAKQRDGISATIERHRRAIEMIQAAGVNCLDEMPNAA